MSEIRLKFDSAGFRALLLSDGVKDLVTDKTTEIAQRANANAGGDGFETSIEVGGYGGGRRVCSLYRRRGIQGRGRG